MASARSTTAGSRTSSSRQASSEETSRPTSGPTEMPCCSATSWRAIPRTSIPTIGTASSSLRRTGHSGTRTSTTRWTSTADPGRRSWRPQPPCMRSALGRCFGSQPLGLRIVGSGGTGSRARAPVKRAPPPATTATTPPRRRGRATAAVPRDCSSRPSRPRAPPPSRSSGPRVRRRPLPPARQRGPDPFVHSVDVLVHGGRQAGEQVHNDANERILRTYEEAKRRGYEIVHPSPPNRGVWRFFVRAPNGNLINIVGHKDENRSLEGANRTESTQATRNVRVHGWPEIRVTASDGPIIRLGLPNGRVRTRSGSPPTPATAPPARA